jgi:hypothetical protein
MTTIDRRKLIASLGAGLLGTVAWPAWGETAKPPAEGGLGGTGIVGTLMGFGSLLVNGLQVGTDAGTSYSSTLGPFDPAALAIGQSLTVEAATEGGALVAKRVHVTYPVVGRAEVLAGAGRLRVAGIDVVAEPDGMTAVRPGERVLVSGVWRDDVVVAGRIDPAPDRATSAIAGAVRRDGRTGRLTLGGRPLQLAAGIETPEDGSFVTVRGRAIADRFVAEDLVPGRFTGAAGPLVRLSVDGYLEPIATAPRFEIAGFGHSFDPDARLAPFQNVRALFRGPYVGVFAVETGIVLPEAFAARQALMEELAERPASVPEISARA